MEYIELVEECKLVRSRSEVTGHDCWGNYEHTKYKYVWINGKKKDVYDGFYIIHDGTEVKEIISSNFLLDCRQREIEHLAKTGFSTPREYAAYLKGRAEIENNPELLQEKIQEIRTKKLKKLKDK
jgi:hypothetical protein